MSELKPKKWAVNQTEQNSKMLYCFFSKKNHPAGHWYHEGGSLGTYLCEEAVERHQKNEFWENHYKIDYKDWIELPEVKSLIWLELNPQLKERFFALYLGIERIVIDSERPHMKYAMDIISLGYAHLDSMSLELRPLSSITSTELQELSNLMGLVPEYNQHIISVDWHRHKGFLLPFMGIKEKQWIEWGVVKLKEV